MKALTKIVVILAVGVAVSILLGTLVAQPLLSEVTAINSEVREKKVELAVLQQQIRAFKNAQADLAKATRKDDILTAIPIKEDLVLSVIDLEQSATKTSSTQLLQIREVNPKEKPPPQLINRKSGVEEVPYDLIVRNQFDGVVDFLAYLEHLPHFTEVSKFSLVSERLTGSEVDTGGRSGVVLGNFSGVFFIQTKK